MLWHISYQLLGRQSEEDVELQESMINIVSSRVDCARSK
jgi:hypothetical protein